MNAKTLAQRPHVLEFNRVERFYTGGKLLDRWQGITGAKDSHFCEESIVTTTPYIGPAKDVPENGISRTRLDDGSFINLRDLIQLDENAFLGSRYAGKTHGQAGVLARVGDSMVRLVIQVHPDTEGAKKHLHFPSGKTEAWHIMDTRIIDGVAPYVYVGFKKGITPQRWRDVFDRQDIDGMLDCMHRLAVKDGDVILIEAGTPHAMGSGCLFLEIHEPCDYTIRTEKNYFGHKIPDTDLHYGMGFDVMFSLFHYDTYTEEEIRRRAMPQKALLDERESGTLTRLISYDDTDRFMMESLALTGTYRLPIFDGHALLITTVGETALIYEGGRVTVPQGRGVFVPSEVKGLQAAGDGELVIAYPYRTITE